MTAKKKVAPQRKRSRPGPLDLHERLREPKWLQQILCPQFGYSSPQLARLISRYVQDIQRANDWLSREKQSMTIEIESLRGKIWGDLDDGAKMPIMRKFGGTHVKEELDKYEKTNVMLRRELKKLQTAMERGLLERG